MSLTTVTLGQLFMKYIVSAYKKSLKTMSKHELFKKKMCIDKCIGKIWELQNELNWQMVDGRNGVWTPSAL